MAAVCVDASVVLSRLLPEQLSPQTKALWERWRRDSAQVICPPLLYAEVPSVLREAVYHRRLEPEDGEEAFATFCALGIATIYPDDLHIKVWELGKEVNSARLYDLQYVALAALAGCDLWTADRRLFNHVRERCPWVHWVGESS